MSTTSLSTVIQSLFLLCICHSIFFIKMIFSVQNNFFMYSVEVWPNQVKFKCEKQSLDLLWHKWTSRSKSGVWWKWCEGISTNIIWHKYSWQRTNLDTSKWWSKGLSTWEWTTPTFLILDIWLNQSTISSFLGRGKCDQPTTPSQ